MEKLNESYFAGKHIAVFGASGAIGNACASKLNKMGASLTLFSRTGKMNTEGFISAKIQSFTVDITDEAALETAAETLKSGPPLDGILVTTGMLHHAELQPEKSIKQLHSNHFMRIIEINTLGPALVAKYFLPLLARRKPVWFAALSARVGSIDDNRLGGWYAYRASKAALNMVIKNLSIEMARRHPNATVVGLHPGTVDSALSLPFQSTVKPEKLFTPTYSANCLLRVIANLSPEDSGLCFDWAGKKIPA